jgi:hypothetical protein
MWPSFYCTNFNLETFHWSYTGTSGCFRSNGKNLCFYFPWASTFSEILIPAIASSDKTSMCILITTNWFWICLTFSLGYIRCAGCTCHAAVSECLLNWITRRFDTLYLNRATDRSIFHSTHGWRLCVSDCCHCEYSEWYEWSNTNIHIEKDEKKYDCTLYDEFSRERWQNYIDF